MSEDRKVEMISIDEIMIPDERVTSQIDDEILEELRESIKQHGILEPLLVAKISDKLVLIDGLHRMLVAKELGIDKVPCIVKEMTEDELLITNLIVNRQRGKSNPADEAKLVKLLVDKYNYSLSEAARRLGMSKSTAEKYYQIASNLSTKVLDMMAQGLISVGCAYWLSFIEDKSKQEEIAEAAVRFGYTVEQCKEASRQALNPEYEPPPGAWTFTDEGQPQRVPIKAYPCLEDVDPSQVTYIPVDTNRLEELKILFQEYCKAAKAENIQPQEIQQQEPQQPEQQNTAKQQQQQQWWPF